MNGKARFKKLLEPAYIGKVRTRNRIIKTAAGMSFIGEYGFSGERRKAFYGVLARGGVGLIIVTALPLRPNAELTRAMTGKALEVYAVGDCSEPRFIMDAIGDGYRIARAI